jgi:mono/diheme cytochrome c family protein
LILTLLFGSYSCLINKTGKQSLVDLQQAQGTSAKQDSQAIIRGYADDEGNADAGYQYLLHGNIFSSGIPLRLNKYVQWAKNTKAAALAGYNKYVLNDFAVGRNDAGNLVANPGCLHCHAQRLNNELIIGLGNSYSNSQDNKTQYLKVLEATIKLIYGKDSHERRSAGASFETGYVLAPLILTEMQGPTAAHRIAEVMASHRDPKTLVFRADTSYFSIPPVVIPIDVPGLWISKKRNAFTINAMEQGNLLKHLMSPAILTLRDTAEAAKILQNMKDVWAFIKTLEPPEYPYSINPELARKGESIFVQTCSPCHGSYGMNEYYPNKLVPGKTIGTDSLMWKYYTKYPEYAEWFNKSWFATTTSPAFIKPQAGYIAPPLDGVWATAPYFHNGSVPTVEGVLNSDSRPRYWKRNFNRSEYDYQHLGWKYKILVKHGGKRSYNTDIPGYGNYGHYFGDQLSDEERKAVIEYLKTL